MPAVQIARDELWSASAEKEDQTEEGRRDFRRRSEEKPGKKTQFQTGGFNAFSFRR